MPISIPVIDMVEIGAGGGSLAHVDGMRQIRVGPESAGSQPGPACYGRGGTAPAVTDADLVLGKLDPENFAGGSIRLQSKDSMQSLQQHIGQPLGLDEITSAFGVVEVVDENMANAARVHAVENGEDLSRYTMIAFGGAAPLHAARLCQKLGIRRMLIPPGAGVGSAIGFLRAPYSFEANRSLFSQLDAFDAEATSRLLQLLQEEATSFVRACDQNADIQAQYKVYMRYAGQGWEIPVRLTVNQALNLNAALLQALFEQEYAMLFGRTVTGMPIEITQWAVNAATPAEVVDPLPQQQTVTPVAIGATRPIYDCVAHEFTQANLVARGQLATGDAVLGPAAITEDETTVIVPAGARVIVQADGALDIQFDEGIA